MEEKIKNCFGSSGNYEDIYTLAEELKRQERAVIDFSTPSNPLGVSKKIKAELRRHLKYLHNYPDPEARRLKKRISQHYGIAPETILCGNGSTEIIYLLATSLKPRKVIIPAPTFSGYERACHISCNSEVMHYRLKAENNFDLDPNELVRTMEEHPPIAENRDSHRIYAGAPPFPNCNMVFLCNPNNPTGRLLKRDGIKTIADSASKLGYYLVVDESFIDFCPDHSVIWDVAENPYLIVLRSMSSFYAIAGLRFGYGVISRQLAEGLKEYKEPWTVNSLAQRAAVVALKDKAFRKETIVSVQEERRYLEKNLGKMGMELVPSEANFFLARMDHAADILLKLRWKGILLHDCGHLQGLDSTHIRIAVKSHRENTILVKELKGILQSCNK